MPHDLEGLRIIGTFRHEVANALSILIPKQFPGRDWPTDLLMALEIPAMRDGLPDGPRRRLGFELMDLFDAAVQDSGQWETFEERFADFRETFTK